MPRRRGPDWVERLLVIGLLLTTAVLAVLTLIQVSRAF